MTVSLRIPEALKKRVAALADRADSSAHAFMVEAIREKVDAAEALAAFRAEGERRLARMKRTGFAIPAEEVFDYFERRTRGESPVRPKARKLP